MKEIAVHMGADGQATDFQSPGRVALYRFGLEGWQIAREMPLCVEREMGLVALHRAVGAILEFLGECRVFLAGARSGVLTRVLGHYGVSMWEYERDPEASLDYVWSQVGEAGETHPVEEIWPGPQDKGDGNFSISLLGSQAKTSGLTSKQLLQGFLNTAAFKTLEVFCSHMPPWMEAECANGRLRCRKQQLAVDELRLVFRPVR